MFTLVHWMRTIPHIEWNILGGSAALFVLMVVVGVATSSPKK